MNEFATPGVQFAGIGATAGGAAETSRLLAERLGHWLSDHPGSRILSLQVQSAAIGAELHLTAVIAYIDGAIDPDPLLATAAREHGNEPSEGEVVALAEEIVAGAQHED
jgi:hypothetical protein